MKLFFTISIIMLSVISTIGQESNPNYDVELVEKLGADDYGMKSFVFVILKTGTNESTDEELRNAAFRGHMNNINRLVESKKMIVAGPFGKNDSDFRGLFILDVPTLEEAKELLETDPAINASYLKVELYEWYGPAALPEYRVASDKIWKVKP